MLPLGLTGGRTMNITLTWASCRMCLIPAASLASLTWWLGGRACWTVRTVFRFESLTKLMWDKLSRTIGLPWVVTLCRWLPNWTVSVVLRWPLRM